MSNTVDIPEVLFDRFFTGNPSPVARSTYRGRAETVDLGDAIFNEAIRSVRTEINKVFTANASTIRAPYGQPRIHFDFVQSGEANAFAFYSEGWAFVAITTALLQRISGIAQQLWRLNLLEDILGIALTLATRNLLAATMISTQIQILSSHELGHFFHGHCEPGNTGSFIADFHSAFGGKATGIPSDCLKDQAMEVEADGYTAHMLLENLFEGGIGLKLHQLFGSTLDVDSFILKFFLCALGSLFYLWGNRAFDQNAIRNYDHPPALMRLNVFMRDTRGWFSNHKPLLETETSVQFFQTIMSAVEEAAEGSIDPTPWQHQGNFLLTPVGQAYIDDLYATREVLREEMRSKRWRKIDGADTV